jgi:hypothetical protein
MYVCVCVCVCVCVWVCECVYVCVCQQHMQKDLYAHVPKYQGAAMSMHVKCFAFELAGQKTRRSKTPYCERENRIAFFFARQAKTQSTLMVRTIIEVQHIIVRANGHFFAYTRTFSWVLQQSPCAGAAQLAYIIITDISSMHTMHVFKHQ